MLHLELRVPSELTDQVVDRLVEDDTVTNVAVLPGGFRKPPGCLVLADVARENASSVIEDLKGFGLAEHGSISIHAVDTLLSAEADRAEKAAPGAPDDGVVWESVEQRLREDSRLTWVFLVFITLAGLIAGAGRILDQPILIVGAMVVGPEFSPIAAICFGLARPRASILPRAVGTLVGGFGVALVVCTVVWSVAHLFGAFTPAQAGTGELTDFIVRPDGWSFVVACLAGVAGTLSLTTAKSGPLVGVFISVTTIPAVGAAAVCLASGVWSEVGSSLSQLGLNVLGLVLAGTATLLLQRSVWSRIGPPSVDTLRAASGVPAPFDGAGCAPLADPGRRARTGVASPVRRSRAPPVRGQGSAHLLRTTMHHEHLFRPGGADFGTLAKEASMPGHTPARWDLPDDPSLDWLRKRAKLLRRAYADPAADRHDLAVELVTTYDPPAPVGPIPLARAQRVLARAFGFAGWSKLREHLAVIDAFSRPMKAELADESPVDRFLRTVCLSYTESAAAEHAAEMLRAEPSLDTASAHAWPRAVAPQSWPGSWTTTQPPCGAEGGPHALATLALSRLLPAPARRRRPGR